MKERKSKGTTGVGRGGAGNKNRTCIVEETSGAEKKCLLRPGKIGGGGRNQGKANQKNNDSRKSTWRNTMLATERKERANTFRGASERMF